MGRLSDVALALELHAESKADLPEVTITYRKGPQSRWRPTIREEWQQGNFLGKGTFGEVYLEHCLTEHIAGRVRAVKRLQKDRNEDYYHELNALALFSLDKYRESFVQCFGWYITDQHLYVAMEYLPHGDLQQYLDQPLPEREARLITSQILEALECMHEMHFTHRDLKPGNILVASARQPYWRVKLCDFGISKRAEKGLTSLRTPQGTREFAAPEVLLPDDQQTYTNAVDMWSTGIITFLMLVGMTNINFNELLRYAYGREQSLPDQALVARNVTSDGIAFVTSMLEHAPQKRPSAAESLHHPWLSQHDLPLDMEGLSLHANFTERANIGLGYSNLPTTQRQMTIASQTTESFASSAMWSTHNSAANVAFNSVMKGTAIPRKPVDSMTSRSDPALPTFKGSPPPKHNLNVDSPDLTLHSLRDARKVATSEPKYNMSKTTSPDTLVMVKVSLEKKISGMAVLLEDLNNDVLPVKLRRGLGLHKDEKFQVQWFSDSAGDFELLEDGRPDIFRELLDVARAGGKIRLKVTRSSLHDKLSSSKDPPLPPVAPSLATINTSIKAQQYARDALSARVEQPSHDGPSIVRPASVLREPGSYTGSQVSKPYKPFQAKQVSSESFSISVQSVPYGVAVQLEVKKTDLIRDIKSRLWSLKGAHPDEQHLILNELYLADHATLEHYNIRDKCTLSWYKNGDYPSPRTKRAPDQIRIFVKELNGETYSFYVRVTDTVLSVKEQLQNTYGIPVALQRLIFIGKQLIDGAELAAYGIPDGAALHVVQRLPAQPPPPPLSRGVRP